MKIEANLTKAMVVVDLTNHEAEGITDSEQKERIGNPHKIVSRKKLTSMKGHLLLIRVKYSVSNVKHGHYASKCP